ncbi:MAG: hypothetical protein ABI759_30040 [Candidatus Solibacter sp.]
MRFPIERELRYKAAENGVVIASGNGMTLNIGSGGVSFMAEQQLRPGAFVELSVSWPALLADTCPMRIIVFGRILRCTGTKTACTIDKYEFRTQARSIQATTAIRSDGMLQRWSDGVRKDSLKTNMAGA